MSTNGTAAVPTVVDAVMLEIQTMQAGLCTFKQALFSCTSKFMRNVFMQSYNEAVDCLFEKYREEGIDPVTLPEREEAIVNPTKLSAAILDGVEDVAVPGSSLEEGEPPIDPYADKTTYWKDANKNPAADHRNKPLWGQWIVDKKMEDAITESAFNPNADGSQYKITDENRHLWMGCRKIDTSLSGLAYEPRFEDLIRMIGVEFFLGHKQPDVIRTNDNGGKVRVISAFLHSSPCPDKNVSVHNVVEGRPQGGKSREGVLDCWAKYFVHGVFPAYYVRHGGGLADQAEIVKDFNDFRNDLRAYLQGVKARSPDLFAWLTPSEMEKLLLHPRVMKKAENLPNDLNCVGIETEIVDCAVIDEKWGKQVAAEAANDPTAPPQKAIRLKFAQVAIGLMNKSSVQRFTDGGCILSSIIGYKDDGNQLNIDGSGFMVSRDELKMKLYDTADMAVKFTPFSILAGVDSRLVNLKSPNVRKSMRVIFHSAYAAGCWDTSKPYDNGYNAKRLRHARLLDEVDTSTGGKEGNVADIDAYKSDKIYVKGFKELDADGAAQVGAAQDATGEAEEMEYQAGEELKCEMTKLEYMEKGEKVPASTEEKEQADNTARDARAAKFSDRAAVIPGRQFSDTSSDDGVEDEDDGEDEVSHMDTDDEGSDLRAVSEDEDDAPEAVALEAKEMALTLQRRKVTELEEAKEDARLGHVGALEFEHAAMRESIGGHVTGMQAAAMYTVGVTATIFGCMQKHIGGKTQVRVTKLVTPDAYNDLQLNGARIIDPSKPAKAKGDIRVVEAGIKRLDFVDLRSAKNRNNYLRKWMLDNKCATMINGVCVPIDHIKPPNARGTFTVFKHLYIASDEKEKSHPKKKEQSRPKKRSRKAATEAAEAAVAAEAAEAAEATEAEEEAAEAEAAPIDQNKVQPNGTVPWIVAMMDYFEKAKAMNSARLHNSWDRNGPLYLYSLNELQSQREALKKVRRCAQGLIISNETRTTAAKDKLIADLFMRADTDSAGSMKDVCCYMYAGDRLTLYYRPDPDFERMLENIFDETHDCLPKIKAYLSGVPTMHYSWKDPATGKAKSKLDDDWLKKHYIDPIAQVLRQSVDRPKAAKVAAAALKAKRGREDDAGHDGDDLPAPLERPIFKELEMECKDATTGKMLGHVKLKSIDFKTPTPQPRYMATLFMLIDACRFHNDPEAFLPTPFIGMTKKAGGRAQRYMDHGYHSRIQVHTHTCDIFPNKKLGLCMSEAIQEAFRMAGFDEVERWAGNQDGNMTGEWMDDWVDQVYVTTEEFLPLLQNALMSQEEWCRMLTKEQRDPKRTKDTNANGEDETQVEYDARLNESPDECLTRVIGGQVTKCLKIALDIWCGQNRTPVTDDMPTSEYPSLHKWLMSHVNNSTTTRNRFLRHSVHGDSETELREEVENMCRTMIDLERAHGNSKIAQKFDEAVDRHEEAMDKEHTTTQMEQVHLTAVKDTMSSFVQRIPLPRYSAAHAPGGAIEARDKADAEGWDKCLQQLLAGRETINKQYAEKHGEGNFFTIKNKWSKDKRDRLLDNAKKMKVAGEEQSGGPDKWFGYKEAHINKWIKDNRDRTGSGGVAPKVKPTPDYYFPNASYLEEFDAGLKDTCDAWYKHMTKYQEMAPNKAKEHKRRAMNVMRVKLSLEFKAGFTGDSHGVNDTDNFQIVEDELRGKLSELLDEMALLDTRPKMVELLKNYFKNVLTNTMAANHLASFMAFHIFRTKTYQASAGSSSALAEDDDEEEEEQSRPKKRTRKAAATADVARDQAALDLPAMRLSMQEGHAMDIQRLNGKEPMASGSEDTSVTLTLAASDDEDN